MYLKTSSNLSKKGISIYVRFLLNSHQIPNINRNLDCYLQLMSKWLLFVHKPFVQTVACMFMSTEIVSLWQVQKESENFKNWSNITKNNKHCKNNPKELAIKINPTSTDGMFQKIMTQTCYNVIMCFRANKNLPFKDRHVRDSLHVQKYSLTRPTFWACPVWLDETKTVWAKWLKTWRKLLMNTIPKVKDKNIAAHICYVNKVSAVVPVRHCQQTSQNFEPKTLFSVWKTHPTVSFSIIDVGYETEQ